MNAPYLLQSAAKNVMPLKKDFRLVSKFLQGSDNTGQKKLNPVFHLEYVPDNEWPRAKSCPTNFISIMGTNGADMLSVLFKPYLIKYVIQRRSGFNIVTVEVVFYMVLHVKYLGQ